MTVAALYIDPRGPYPALLGADACWDEKRDARLYDGPWPVVAHPPCGPWGKLKHLYRGNEHDCGPRAVEQVRAFGGVLEHPAGSLLWAHCDIPRPRQAYDGYGITVEVDQCAWGHVARKTSWLYICGVPIKHIVEGMRYGGTPTHWVSGFRSSTHATPKRYRQNGSAVPPGIKICSAQQRRRTPVAFAEWLIALARTVQR